MKAELIQVEPVALMPTQAGCAVFLGDGNKVIVFYIDPAIGSSINSVLANQPSSRPLTRKRDHGEKDRINRRSPFRLYRFGGKTRGPDPLCERSLG